MPRRVRLILGLALAAFGVVLVFLPLEVAAVLNRPPKTGPEMINLRASWGGTLLGLGAFVAWLEHSRANRPAKPELSEAERSVLARGNRAKPWQRFVLGLLMWSMIGVGLGRFTGFVLDGGPDVLQWIWLGAEVVIAAACAFGLRRLARRE